MTGYLYTKETLNSKPTKNLTKDPTKEVKNVKKVTKKVV